MRLSDNVRELQPSATLAVANLCRTMRSEGRDVIDLSAGEPDFRTPDFAAQAGIAAIVQGFTQYTPVAGLPALREAIAQSIRATCGRAADADGVVVSCGAKHSLFNVCFTLFGPGDRVLIPVPYWTSYPEIVRLARAEPVFVETAEDAGLRATIRDLEAARDETTRGLILNSPSNPTGSVYSLEELAAIIEWARAHDIAVISDEIYGRISFTGARAPSVLDLPEPDTRHVIVVDGASKAFAMTGWRLGYTYSDPALARKMASLQSHITSNAATPTQYAALAVYRQEPRVEHAVRAMVGVFRHRRDRIMRLLRQELPDAAFHTPEGAFYLFIRLDAYYREGAADSITFCRWLLEKTGVALVPGAAFGDDRYARLSFAVAEDELVDAVRRMGEALARESAPTPT